MTNCNQDLTPALIRAVTRLQEYQFSHNPAPLDHSEYRLALRQRTIVSDNRITICAEFPGRDIPMRSLLDVGFGDRAAIDIEDPVAERDFLARQPHNP